MSGWRDAEIGCAETHSAKVAVNNLLCVPESVSGLFDGAPMKLRCHRIVRAVNELCKGCSCEPGLVASWRPVGNRSEERRVGKECRSRWAREYEKKRVTR